MADVPSTLPEPPPTIATLDGLRLAAAVIVMLYHFLFLSWVEPVGSAGIRDVVGLPHAFSSLVPVASAGWVGVEVFFVISGFVITMSAQGKTASAFARGRFSRLFPALLVFSLIALAVIAGTGTLPLDEAALRTARSVVLFPRGPWIDGAVWTLVAECVFYALIWGALALRRGDRLARYARVALVGNVAFWLAVALSPFSGTSLMPMAGGYPLRVTLVSTGCYFLLGMFAFEGWSRGWTQERAAMTAAAAACCLVSLCLMAGTSLAAVRFGQGALTPVVLWIAAMAIAACGLATERRRMPRPGTGRALRAMGLLTYPLYLFHQIGGGWLLGRAYGIGIEAHGAVAATALACLAVSHVFAARIERPLRRAIMAGVDVATARIAARIPLRIAQRLQSSR